MTTQPEKQRVHCNKCRIATWHDVLHYESIEDSDEYEDGIFVSWWDGYTLLKCRGCDTVQLKKASSFSEATDEHGRPLVDVRFYPAHISRHQPQWLSSISGPFWRGNTEVERLLKEIYIALHNGSLRLAAMGIRALLEFIMIDKVGDHGNIAKNITAFFKAGYVAEVDQGTFRDKLIEAGHAAMHRSYEPDPKDLDTLLDLTESLVASIYVHPHRTKNLESRIPARRNNRPPSTTDTQT